MAAGLWWLAEQMIVVPTWGAWIGWVVLGVTSFTALGDALNVVQLKRRLRKLGADERKAA